MPVKGLTDEIRPRFPLLGKLRKGGEKTASGFGPDLDHFRFTSDHPGIVEAFQEAYGEKPRTIQVYIPHASVEEAFPVWSEIWGATGLVHRCDGETMTVWLENGKYQRGAKPCPGGHKNNDYLQDAVGRLEMIVPELIEAGYVGYVTLVTHSKNDIIGILSTLHAVHEARQQNELGLRGVLFNLRRVQESISTPGFGKQTGKRSRVDKWLVRLEPAADWVQLQIEMAHASQMQLSSSEILDQTPVSSGLASQPVLSGPPEEPPATLLEQTDGLPEGACRGCGQSGGNHASNCPEWQKQNLAGGNGKGNGKSQNGKANGTMLLSDAAAVKTNKGSALGGLTVEQLKLVSEKGTDAQKAAAGRLLAKVTADEMKRWSELTKKAKAAGLSPAPITPDMLGIELWARVEAVNMEIEQADKLAADLLGEHPDGQ